MVKVKRPLMGVLFKDDREILLSNLFTQEEGKVLLEKICTMEEHYDRKIKSVFFIDYTEWDIYLVE